MSPRASERRCESCGAEIPFGGTWFGPGAGRQQLLCTPCFNRAVADLQDLDFEEPSFDPMTLVDVDGRSHEFHFETRLVPTGVVIDAFEIKDGVPGGHRLMVLDPDPETELYALFGKLVQRIQRRMGRKHLDRGELGLVVTDENVVRGQIEWDDETDGRVPRLVIDGEDVSWDQLGRILMSFEGSLFELEILDASEER